jgi:hypothetical protein
MDNKERKHLRWKRRATLPPGAAIARAALEQHATQLKNQFPNIVSVSDAVVPGTNGQAHTLTIYIADENGQGLPAHLDVQLPRKRTVRISTEIIYGVGAGSVHICQRDEIACGTNEGSICCIVVGENGSRMAASAGHVFSGGTSRNYEGELATGDCCPATVNGSPVGSWCFQQIDETADIALARIDPWVDDAALVSFSGREHYTVSDGDIGHTQVLLLSSKWQPATRTGYILDYNTIWDVPYRDGSVQKTGIICIGSAARRQESYTLSMPGDSGGCVYERNSGRLLGIILGGNSRFTWVLPLGALFDYYNFQLA